MLSRPVIFNSDQGRQFTSIPTRSGLESAGVRISMVHHEWRVAVEWGTIPMKIGIERLWRTVKYEEVYLKSYETVREAREGFLRP